VEVLPALENDSVNGNTVCATGVNNASHGNRIRAAPNYKDSSVHTVAYEIL
jgi:hypothetical protein